MGVVARDETYKENDDVIKGWQFVATLDDRTSTVCASLDGQVFDIGTGPLPPLHPNCRSVNVPALDDRFAALEKGATRIARGPDGDVYQVPADMTYYEWLKTQPPEFQNDAIGKTRAELLRSGELTSKRFAELNLGPGYMPRTLAEMRAAEPMVFGKMEKARGTVAMPTGIPPELRDLAKSWPEIEGDATANANVRATNPHFASGKLRYQNNCQRCVATWEMRMRGYDVIAKPVTLPIEDDIIVKNWNRVFENMRFRDCTVGGIDKVQDFVKSWGDGARGQVHIEYSVNGRPFRHVLGVVQKNGVTHFVDPQDGSLNARTRAWLSQIKIKEISVARIDNLRISNYFRDICETLK